MKIAYFDCFAGASGDMILGSLIDAGLSVERLKGELAKLSLKHYDLQARKVTKRGVGGTQAHVIVDDVCHHSRCLHDIFHIIDTSRLEESVKTKCIQIFTRLAEAEAQVHRIPVERVHFHEVGALDAIIDIVGAVAGMAAMGIECVQCSPLHVGSGTIECDHGTLPVPAPATAELIKGKPVYSSEVTGELLTPTGAAILTTLSADFGPMPPMIPESIGYGAGTNDRTVPNLLRVAIGQSSVGMQGCQFERVAVVETNIDDMTPQIYEYIVRRILDMGAFDVFLNPVHMKKNRPGILLTLICQPDRIGEFSEFLLTETTTIGLRWRIDSMIHACRSFAQVDTQYGTAKVKIAEINGKIVNVAPEFEDCSRIAAETAIPLKNIMECVRLAASREFHEDLHQTARDNC